MFQQATGLTLGLLLVASVSFTAVAQTVRTIRVVGDGAYAPYLFRSDEGKLQGILKDQWQAWEKKTGVKVEIHAMDWGEALWRMRAGEFDVIDSIVETPERREYFDFTPPYATIEALIFFRKDISGITDLASLRGFPVGVKTGDQHIDILKANGVTTVMPFQNDDAIIDAAKQRKLNVFVLDALSAFYLLNKSGIEAEFRHSAPIFRDELRRAVRKGDANLLRTVSQGFEAIEPRELAQIDERWFGRTIDLYKDYLGLVGYAAAAGTVLMLSLAGWNRSLRKGILQRTTALGESEHRFREIAENIQALSRRLVELQEFERKELAHALHDRIGQSLTALNINLTILGNTLPLQASDELRSRLCDSKALIESTTAAIGNILSELRPPMLDDHGLALALDWYARQVAARIRIAVTVRSSLDTNERPKPERELALFRIAQEALNNIAKHARASRVEITLERSGSAYLLSVQDDGVGFDAADDCTPRRPGLGMVIMRERAQAVGGRFDVQTHPGRGTRLSVEVPA
jgi:signal transduction histidine kinase